jgi:DNA-binding beta-propeller fold protein YncE
MGESQTESINRGATTKNFVLALAVICIALVGGVALANPAGPGYYLIKKVPFGAAPGGGEYFDYVTVDSAARRVDLSHGAEVKVLEADHFSVVGTISGLQRCHGVLVLSEIGKGFITNGDAASVAVFDLKTLKITGKIKNPPDTDFILYDPASKLTFTFNGDSKNATAIDSVKETVVNVIAMGGGVEYPVGDGKGTIYDHNEEKSDVAVLDTHIFKIKARWRLAPAGGPAALAMDQERRRLFSSGRDPQFVVMTDADSGKVTRSLPIRSGVDGTIFEPEPGLLSISTIDGETRVLHEDSPNHLSELETVQTEFGAKTMGSDAKTHNRFLTTADFGPTPPAPTKENPEAERMPIPGTFRLLIYGR